MSKKKTENEKMVDKVLENTGLEFLNNTYENRPNYKYFPQAKFIFLNEWSDPELFYKNWTFNIHNVEDYIVSDFEYHCEEEGIENIEENFEKYCQENQDSIQEIFDNHIDYLEDNFYTEPCPNCENEITLERGKITICKHCGDDVRPCGFCEAINDDCGKCIFD